MLGQSTKAGSVVKDNMGTNSVIRPMSGFEVDAFQTQADERLGGAAVPGNQHIGSDGFRHPFKHHCLQLSKSLSN